MLNSKWRVVKTEKRNGFENMALDEAVSEAVAKGESPNTIRFFRWRPSTVTIGYFQSLREEVSVENCLARGFDVVRRITGGGAVYHDENGEITYSVIARADSFPKDLTETYKIIGQWIIDSLAELNLQAEFHPINDILVNNKKISGNAQTRRNGVMHQHGTILFDVDVDTMFSLLKVSDIKIKDKIIKTVKERVTSIKQNSNATEKQLEQALIKGFTKEKEFEFGKWSKGEMQRMQELAEQKYSSREWNYWR